MGTKDNVIKVMEGIKKKKKEITSEKVLLT